MRWVSIWTFVATSLLSLSGLGCLFLLSLFPRLSTSLSVAHDHGGSSAQLAAGNDCDVSVGKKCFLVKSSTLLLLIAIITIDYYIVLHAVSSEGECWKYSRIRRTGEGGACVYV